MTKHLPFLKLGNKVQLRDIYSGTWGQQGQVEEEVVLRSYRIQMESGLSLRKKWVDLQLEPDGSDNSAQEKVQQDMDKSTQSTNSRPENTECGFTLEPASTAAERLSKIKSPQKDRWDLRNMFSHLKD